VSLPEVKVLRGLKAVAARQFAIKRRVDKLADAPNAILTLESSHVTRPISRRVIVTTPAKPLSM
jgi:hypothetical protein